MEGPDYQGPCGSCAVAKKSESETRRQLTLAERETRTVTFQNLSLSRKLQSMSGSVPRSELELVERTVATQAAMISRL